MARNVRCHLRQEVPEVLKNKIYKTAIRPTMTYGGECWAIRICEQNKMNTTGMKMLRFIQGKPRKYHIRNVTIREKVHMKQINTFLMKKRLSWFGHVQRRDDYNVVKSVLNTRPRGRPKLRWMDRLKDDMKKNNSCTWHGASIC